jgi:guanylate kinase
MGIRAQRIREEFPEIPSDHIYMGSSKDKIQVDILFDDGMHNVFGSNAAYPILMRRPWNREATGMLAVNTYEEFLRLVEVIADSYSARREPYSMDQPGVVVLVGPSGSGKSDIAKGLLQADDRFGKLLSYTTNRSHNTEGDWYEYISVSKFRAMCESGEIFESTTYANHCYGARRADVDEILSRGKHVLTIMDICGAMTLKTCFPNVITIYVKRDKKDLLRAILEKKAPVEEKVNRLIAIESETQNMEICDYVVRGNSCQAAVEEIIASLGGRV